MLTHLGFSTLKSFFESISIYLIFRRESCESILAMDWYGQESALNANRNNKENIERNLVIVLSLLFKVSYLIIIIVLKIKFQQEKSTISSPPSNYNCFFLK